jgi:Ulp1 protease family, C-terminal catalytic domain
MTTVSKRGTSTSKPVKESDALKAGLRCACGRSEPDCPQVTTAPDCPMMKGRACYCKNKSCPLILAWNCLQHCPCILEEKKEKTRRENEDRVLREQKKLVENSLCLLQKTIEGNELLAIDEAASNPPFPDNVEERIAARFRDLTTEEEELVDLWIRRCNAFLQKHGGNFTKENEKYVMADPENVLVAEICDLWPIRLSYLARVLLGLWLNDEIMNAFCCGLLQNHVCAVGRAYKGRKAQVEFSSFFMAKLLTEPVAYTYANVSRWTKNIKADQFSKISKIGSNINIANVHWVRGTLDFQKKEIVVRDSYKSDQSKFGGAFKNWVGDEMKKRNMFEETDLASWKVDCKPMNHPFQTDEVTLSYIINNVLSLIGWYKLFLR